MILPLFLKKTMEVSYNPNGASDGSGTNFSDLNFIQVKNRYGIRVELVLGSVVVTDMTTGVTSSTLPTTNVFVKMGVYC